MTLISMPTLHLTQISKFEPFTENFQNTMIVRWPTSATHKYISKHTNIFQNTQIYFKTYKYISKHTNIFQNTQIYFKTHKHISKHTNIFQNTQIYFKMKNTEINVETPK